MNYKLAYLSSYGRSGLLVSIHLLLSSCRAVCLAALVLLQLGAQTKVNLAHQTTNTDFSGAQSTKPVKVVTLLPAVCSVGEIVFKSDAPAGRNLYTCTATNTWNLQGSGEFEITKSGPNELTIGPGCSTSKPCSFRLGNSVALLSAAVTITISSALTTANAFLYIDGQNALVAGHETGITLACSACAVASGVTAFPVDSLPLARWGATATVGQWDASGDIRIATMNRDLIKSGEGLISTVEPSGAKSVAVDPARIPRYSTGIGAPSGACQTARDFYLDASNGDLYKCFSSAWSLQGGAAPVAALDPSVVKVEEDFCKGTSGSSTSNAAIGSHGWRYEDFGIGSLTLVSPEQNHDCLWLMSTNSTVEGNVTVDLGDPSDAVAGIFSNMAATASWEVVAVFKTGDDLSQINFRVGLAGTANIRSANGRPDNGIWVGYSNNSGCTVTGSDTALTYETRNTAASTRVASSVSPATSAWYKVRMRSLASGTVLFSIATNGGSYTSETAIDTNIPTAQLYPFFQVQTCSANSRRIYVDYYGAIRRGVAR